MRRGARVEGCVMPSVSMRGGWAAAHFVDGSLDEGLERERHRPPRDGALGPQPEARRLEEGEADHAQVGARAQPQLAEHLEVVDPQQALEADVVHALERDLHSHTAHKRTSSRVSSVNEENESSSKRKSSS
eukprot:51178-Pleurochrysis_carterae.AAC.1